MIPAGITARKSLGQNFLIRPETAAEIVSLASLGPGDTVVEVGAGTGMLTEALAAVAGRVISFEVDRSLLELLGRKFASRPSVEIVPGDFLQVAPAVLDHLESFKVVSNPPYYISSPIIFFLLRYRPSLGLIIMTLQKELARRLVACPGNREYGVLTLTVALDMEAEIVKTLGRGAFHPAPGVESAVVRFRPRRDLIPGDEAEMARRVIRAVFTRRRKTVLNALSSAFDLPRDRAESILVAAGVNPGFRPKKLSLFDYLSIAGRMTSRDMKG